MKNFSSETRKIFFPIFYKLDNPKKSMEIGTELKKIYPEELKFNKDKFILLDKEEQLDFIRKKLDFLIENLKLNNSNENLTNINNH